MKKDLYVLTGFLGAGKTSLLLHLLDNMSDKKIGVIQNEFGKLNVDGEIVRRGNIEMTEIGRGSVFCSCLKLTFVNALAEMSRCDLDCVFVESSGLADPASLNEVLEAVKVLAGDAYELKGIICLIDSVNFPEQLKDAATVDSQLAHCHMAVVNKTDLVDGPELAEVIELVRSVNPICRITTAVNGKISLDFLGEDLTSLEFAPCDSETKMIDYKPKTFSLECEQPVSRCAFMDFINEVLPAFYRIKGFFRFEDGWFQVDTVEKLVQLAPCEEKESSHIVFISKIGLKAIREVDNAWRDKVGIQMKMRN